MIVVAGPTASGKSGLALDLARRLGGRIINADSMQVYRDVPTLTARPSPAEEKTAEHRLYGFLEPEENCSVFKWVRLAAREIAEAWEKGRVPIVVGGTGFYLQTLIKGISPVPQADETVRGRVRREFEESGYDRFLADFRKKILLFLLRIRSVFYARPKCWRKRENPLLTGSLCRLKRKSTLIFYVF